jgi:hypothetical protein
MNHIPAKFANTYQGDSVFKDEKEYIVHQKDYTKNILVLLKPMPEKKHIIKVFGGVSGSGSGYGGRPWNLKQKDFDKEGFAHEPGWTLEGSLNKRNARAAQHL